MVLGAACALMLMVVGCQPSQEAMVVSSLRDKGLRVGASNSFWSVAIELSKPVQGSHGEGDSKVLFAGTYKQVCIGRGGTLEVKGEYEVRRRSSFDDGEQFLIDLRDCLSVYDWETGAPLEVPEKTTLPLWVGGKSLRYWDDGPNFLIR